MSFKSTLKRLDVTLVAFKLQGPMLFLFVTFLVTQPILSQQQYLPSSPTIECDVNTDKKIYSIGEIVTIRGYLILDYFYSDIRVQISIFDWSDGSTLLLVDDKKDFKAMMLIHLREFNEGKSIQWVCNRTGEYGINVHIEKENDPDFPSINFVKGRFLVTEDGLFIDVFTDHLTYLESQIVNVSYTVLSKEYLENFEVNILLYKNSKLIREIYNSTHDINPSEEVNIEYKLDSRNLDGIYHIYFNFSYQNLNIIYSSYKSTKINVIKREKLNDITNALFLKHEWLQNDQDLLYLFSKSNGLQSDPSINIELSYLILEIYHNLTNSEKEALFFVPPVEDSYLSTGDLLLWLYTDFVEATDLELTDGKILFSYASVFDDFFIQDLQYNRYWKILAWNKEKEEMSSWIKEYMIDQCQFFGVELLRETANDYGIAGLSHVIYPNFDERFGDTKNQFMPLEAYEAIREYLENMEYDGVTIARILREKQNIEAIDQIQSILWSEINSNEYMLGPLDVIPTTQGFYRIEVLRMLEGGMISDSCVSVSRLVALIGRTLGLPVGILNPSGVQGHWGNYILYNDTIWPDTQSHELFQQDNFSSERNYIIRWPSLFHYNEYGFGLKKEYIEKFDISPGYCSEIKINSFLKIINAEMEEIKQLHFEHEWLFD